MIRKILSSDEELRLLALSEALKNEQAIEQQIEELNQRLNSHSREHVQIVNQEGWEAGKLKRTYMKNIKQQISTIKNLKK